MLRETCLPSCLSIRTVPSASAIPRQAWDHLCPAGHPFLHADFLCIIERHGAAAREWGWAARHLLASVESGRIVGLLPLYMKTHSHDDFIYDWSWAAAYRSALFLVLHSPNQLNSKLFMPNTIQAKKMRRAILFFVLTKK